MHLKLDSKRRLTIPRSLLATNPGDQFEARFDAEDDVLIIRRIPRKAGWLEVWKECPVLLDEVPARSKEMPKKVRL